MQRLDGSTTLTSGLRLRLRIPHRSDAEGLRDLLGQLGVPADDLAISRLLRFDPRERVTVVAGVLIDRSEEIVGIAVMEHGASEPELLAADEARAPGTAAALAGALRAHGEHTSRIA